MGGGSAENAKDFRLERLVTKGLTLKIVVGTESLLIYRVEVSNIKINPTYMQKAYPLSPHPSSVWQCSPEPELHRSRHQPATAYSFPARPSLASPRKKTTARIGQSHHSLQLWYTHVSM